jgi:PAS domain S-box-containing protein
LLTVSAVRDDAGKILYFVDQIENITERRQAAQDLQLRLEQEREFQTYLKALHEITVELTSVEDIDTFYKRAVELGLERLGFERLGLLLYDPINDLGLGTYGTDPSGKLMKEDHIAFKPSNNDGLLRQTFNSEIRFVVNKDASLYHNMKVIGRGWNAAAVLWHGEFKLGWLAIDNAITGLPIRQTVLEILSLYAMSLGTLLAQKRSQTALVNQRNLLRTLIDNLPDVIYVKDLQSRFVLVNRAFMDIMNTTDENTIIGKWDFDLHSPERAQAFWDEEQQLLKSGDTVRERVEQVIYPNGRTRYLSTFKTPLRDSHGNIIGLVGTNRDITERLELEAALLDKEKLEATLIKELELSELKSRMMERISHEFRTPLSIIQLTTETYTNYFDRLKPEQKASKIAAIRQSTRQLTEMLNEIAIVVEDQFSAENLSLADLNLRYIIESNAHELDVQNNVLGKFVLQIPEIVTLKADRDVMQAALFHIMHNAAQYSAPRSPVQVQVTVDEAGVIMRFADQGIGIMPEELPRIFEPFFRGSNIDEISGLGVGLTIAAKGIEAHRGRITIDSTVGQGTTVTIHLPHNTPKNGRP